MSHPARPDNLPTQIVPAANNTKAISVGRACKKAQNP